ncbi:hypothetical protein [Candidatus Soleaferrea massiliensis]|uniref:hypothetical protein n=1 Tax=Candidatus Soleaferrea massiliensis TaxID=1470354 RepID=UPI00058BADB4|nr:hypothetical protein [Candidatus Soleaferrea massiliensis]
MFNVYYINYAKAFEISMLIDNRVQTQASREKDSHVEGTANADIDTSGLSKVPYLGKLIPKFEMDGEINGVKSKKVIDTFNVVSTKSTVLNPIYEKAKCENDLSKLKSGELVKIEGLNLEITNPDDVAGTKALLSGALNQIPIDGIGTMDITSIISVFLKDSSYIIEGTVQSKKNEYKVMLKIPMQAENEMESFYNVSDIEIGEVSIVGVYKGKFSKNDLEKKINRMKSLQEKGDSSPENADITDIEDGQEMEQKSNNEDIHYIDIIAIVQDIIL